MKQNDEILDSPLPRAEKPPYNKWLRGIAIGLEIALWSISALGLLFKAESWEGGSELLVLSFSMLSLFYMLFTFLVTGARGWRQILGSVGAGITYSMLLLSVLFIRENWVGGWEMRITALLPGGIILLAGLYFLVRNRQTGKKTGYYWNILIRLAIMMLLAI